MQTVMFVGRSFLQFVLIYANYPRDIYIYIYINIYVYIYIYICIFINIYYVSANQFNSFTSRACYKLPLTCI